MIQAVAAATVGCLQNAAGPKLHGPAMKQPTFNWESEDKYSKLKNFKFKTNNILKTVEIAFLNDTRINE